MKTLVLWAASIFAAIAAYSGEVQFSATSHDFGQFAGGYCQPATFTVTNNTDAPIAIIRVQASHIVRTRFQRGYIRPGQSATISMTVEKPTMGQFDESVEVFLSHSTKPFPIRISGTTVSAVECFPDKSNWEMREIRIVDAETRSIIPGAEAHFKQNMEREIPLQRRDGKLVGQLPIGMYGIEANAKGYTSTASQRLIRKTEPIVYVELSRTSIPEPITVPQEHVVTEPAPVAEPVPMAVPTAQPKTETSDSILPEALYKENNIVFLIDVSLSMKRNGKMQNVQKSMHRLIDALRPHDSIGIAVYNNTSRVIASHLSGNDKAVLHRLVDSLSPEGLTNGVAGLQTAYKLALQTKNASGNNQLLLITDGEFSGSGQSAEDLEKIVESYAAQDIKLSILSFGEDPDAIAGLKRITRKGTGNYIEFSNLQTENILLDEIKHQSLKQ